MNNNICKTSILNGGKVTQLIIPHSLSHGLGLTNPSILKINNKLIVNIRHVQYALYHSEKLQKFQSPYGPLVYLNPEDDITLTTRNFLCELDLNYNIKTIDEVDTSKLDVKPIWEFVGLEDARLINWYDSLILTGVRRDTTTNGVGRMELSAVEENKEISRVRIEPPTDSYCEKNWMPILDLPNHYVKWCNPTEIVEIDVKTKSSKTIKIVKQNINLPRDLRGGSQVIKYKDYWVALTHEVDLWYNEQGNKDAQYYHRFILWDKDWNIVHCSKDFKFMDAKIEFSCGLHFENDKFLIPFGFQDTTAFLLELPVSEFELMVGLRAAKPKNITIPNDVLSNYILNVEDAKCNFDLGLNYFNKKQYASALSFFLRCAELEPIKTRIFKTDIKSNLTYESLLFIAKCIQNLGKRDGTELALWNNALRYDPTRPEAYLFISQYYEVRNQFSQSQSYARIGLEFKNNNIPINQKLNYEHYYQLMFQDALCDWNLGQGDSARNKFRHLGMSNYPLDLFYTELIQTNITSLGAGGNPFLPYNKSMSENLRYKFDGYNEINFNFSQTFQDMFTLTMLNGLKNGYYLEIGAADPYKGSNSALLEDLGWSGISLEILENEVDKFKKVRKNPVVLCNALEYDYSNLPKIVDYLQLDCEPPAITYEIMTKLPFDTTDFKVITYEHDFYTDLTGKYRQLSRDFLKSKGYLMVVGNIAPDETSAYEDWYVKPEYIDNKILDIMLDLSDNTQNAKSYMLK
jgi:hypothetical protein